MIDGWEKLSEVKGDHASLEFSMPSPVDNMSEDATSIFSGVLTNAPELVRMKDSMFRCFKLQPIKEHFLKHLAQSVKKNYWANSFPGFGITTVVEALNLAGQWPD
jgi:hypothetical protein